MYKQCGGAFVHWKPGRMLIDTQLSRVYSGDQLDASIALAANKYPVSFWLDGLAGRHACPPMTLVSNRCCAAILLEKHRKRT